MISNLTPHSFNYYEGAEEAKAIQPSGWVARCSQEDILVGDIEGINLFESSFGPVRLEKKTEKGVETKPFPSAREGVYHIVSRLVLASLPSREDLVVPTKIVRDDKGRIVGAEGLTKK